MRDRLGGLVEFTRQGILAFGQPQPGHQAERNGFGIMITLILVRLNFDDFFKTSTFKNARKGSAQRFKSSTPSLPDLPIHSVRRY